MEKYQIFEIYGNFDGNDDMLSDIGDVSNGVRRGMWALVPDNVGDNSTVSINEIETPAIKPYTIQDKNYAVEIANAFAQKVHLGQPTYYHGGSNGHAFTIGDNVLLKITTDVSEGDAALKTIIQDPKFIAKIYGVYKIYDTEKGLTFLAILQDNIKDKPVQKFSELNNIIDEIMPNGMGRGDFFSLMRRGKFNDTTYPQLLEMAKHTLTDNPNLQISPEIRKEAYNYLVGLINIRKELYDFSINSNDYMENNNLGYKNGVLTFFDIGNYVAKEPNVPEDKIITLPEDASALYSTDDGVGRFETPTYNQKDSSEPLDANIATCDYEIKEDLEYNHVDGDATQDEYKLEERELSSMAGSSTVDVKKNCRLAGKGNTSDACNQGDINNLNIKPLNEAVKGKKFYRAVEKFGGKTVEFEPEGYYEAIDDEGNPVIKYDTHWVSEKPETAASYSVGGAVMGLYSMFRQHGKAPNAFYIYVINEEPDVDISHWDMGDFAHLQEVRYRRPVRGTYVGEVTITDDIKEKLDAYYEIVSSDEYEQPIYDPEYEKAQRIFQDTDYDKYLAGVKNQVHEVVDPKDVNDNKKAIMSVVNGKRKVGLGEINKSLGQAIEKRRLGVHPLRMTSRQTMMVIVYNRIAQKEANRLLEIAKSHGGYLADKTAEEAREIGRLLEYREDKIEEYVQNRYGKKVPVMQEPQDVDINQLSDLEEQNFSGFEKQINKDNATHGLDKKILYQEDDFKVCEVNGDEVRDGGFIEWVDGGHHYVDAYLPKEEQKYAKHIPEDEIWVDDVFTAKPNDMAAIILHEKLERYLMKNFGLKYENAHTNYANKAEMVFRKKVKDGFGAIVSEKIFNIFVEKFKEKRGKKKKQNEDVGYDYGAKLGVPHPHAEFEKQFGKEQSVVNKEEFIDDEYGMFNIIKNPKSLANLGDGVRGVIDNEGNLYVEHTSMYIHDELLTQLHDLGIVKYVGRDWHSRMPDEYITVQRFESTNKFLVGESNILLRSIGQRSSKYQNEPSRAEALPVFQEFLDKAKIKNPKIEFINEIVPYYTGVVQFIPDTDESLNEAMLMSLQDLPFKQEVEQLGGKIFSVGGAVRDEFLGKESKDLDILITGVPFDQLEEILGKYGRVDAVGKSFGVLKFRPQGGEEIDIAIPRTEKATGAGGHQGFDVTSDHALPIEKDLERRDFTINAIAKDIEGNIVDPYGGQEDLKNKIIRVVNPEAFSDDPLRMLRAVQFASRFGFTIEPNTLKMIQDNASRVREIAPERILTEFDKIIKKGNILTGVELLINTGLFMQIFGKNLKPSMIGRRDFSSVKTMGEFIFLLTNGIVQNPAAFFKTNLKGDIDAFKEIKALELAFDSGEATNLVEARSVAHNMYLYSPQALQSQILPSVIETAAQELLQGKYPKTVNELALNGNDLVELGLKGKAIGDMQKSLLLKIYANKVRNSKEELLNLAGKNNDMLKEFSYPEMRPDEQKSVWDVNGEQVDINFFIEKYDIWNQDGYTEPSEESILEFLQNNYEDFSYDEKLKKELLWALTDRNLLDEGVLNEMSINSITYDNIVTPEYINDLKRSDNYERYLEYFKYEYGLEDQEDEELEKHPAFERWFSGELYGKYEYAVESISNKIKPDGTIDIWRRIKVDDIWVNHLIQAGKHLGIYWSWDERAAEAHWGDTAKNSNALIKSSIKEQYIDWNSTLDANMNISLGEDEKEITLFKNTSLRIEELYIDGQDVEDVMGSDYEAQLRSKIFYA